MVRVELNKVKGEIWGIMFIGLFVKFIKDGNDSV